jgi:hypothetical protein
MFWHDLLRISPPPLGKWHRACETRNMSAFSGQIILVGTAVSEGFDARVAKGSTCPMICILDCDILAQDGRIAGYETDDGLDAGRILDETLGQSGWRDIKVRACLPVAETPDGWEPELAALIRTARHLGIAHMVFEPEAQRPALVH